MNIMIRLATSLVALAPLRKHLGPHPAGTGGVRRIWTRGQSFLTQPPDAVCSSVLLSKAAYPSRPVSHWVILEGGSRRMFWTLST